MSYKRRDPPPDIRDKFRGCLLGGAVGDALGAPVEFMSQAEIKEKYGEEGISDLAPAYGVVGAITDDTQMTLFTAEGVIRAYIRGTIRGTCSPPGMIHQAYLRWLYTQGEPVPFDLEKIDNGWLITNKELFASRSPGNTCISALSTFSSLGDRASNDSKGCGGVMRVAPIGMLFNSLSRKNPGRRKERLWKTFDLACEAAALTHGHPTGFLSAGTMARIVFELLDGIDLPTATKSALGELEKHPGQAEVREAVERSLRLAGENLSPHEAIRAMGEGWIAEEALAIGLYCAVRATDFESGVKLAVNHDGDSDSTGIIAGHLLGAKFGLQSIPERWISRLELRNVIEEMADDLATAGNWRLDQWDDPDARAEEDYYTNRYPGS